MRRPRDVEGGPDRAPLSPLQAAPRPRVAEGRVLVEAAEEGERVLLEQRLGAVAVVGGPVEGGEPPPAVARPPRQARVDPRHPPARRQQRRLVTPPRDRAVLYGEVPLPAGDRLPERLEVRRIVDRGKRLRRRNVRLQGSQGVPPA